MPTKELIKIQIKIILCTDTECGLLPLNNSSIGFLHPMNTTFALLPSSITVNTKLWSKLRKPSNVTWNTLKNFFEKIKHGANVKAQNHLFDFHYSNRTVCVGYELVTRNAHRRLIWIERNSLTRNDYVSIFRNLKRTHTEIW